MEDYLITFSVSFADSETGEVLANSLFKKPLSMLTDEDITKYFHSFLRGIRLDKKPV